MSRVVASRKCKSSFQTILYSIQAEQRQHLHHCRKVNLMVSSQTAFQTGDDFISFDLSPPPSSAAGPSSPRKQSSNPKSKTQSKAANGPKGKGRDENIDSDLLDIKNGKNRNDDSVLPKGKRDRTINNNRNGSKGDAQADRKGKGKVKRSREDEDADEGGYRNLKEERMAKERQAPWADRVDWGRCRDAAEMLVSFPLFKQPSSSCELSQCHDAD